MEWLREPEVWVGLGFVLVIGFFLYKRIPAMIGKQLDARAAAISKELDEAKRLREEAETLLAQYKRKAAEADKEAEAILIEARAEAERFATDSRAALAQQIERRGKAAQEKIAQAEAQAVAEVRARSADLAVEAARVLLQKQMATQGDALVEKAIKDVAAKLN